ncbi:MAG TPA: dihydroxyacetone kinase phosphoryl donor subunit DhaM [Mycobacteriales bacterium]|nr:dihydroxyacetone kinase phosphoryl donor subunit DhaM [Mycobacteriales bacterium]
MVGIVLVSHSPRLAAGLAELLAELGGGEVPVAVAAGTADGRLGTDPAAVTAAITAADQGDGVLLIPDLGSAVLSVRVALDDRADPVRALLIDAPFVEGAVAATVTASTGADLEAVATAAQEARTIPKL